MTRAAGRARRRRRRGVPDRHLVVVIQMVMMLIAFFFFLVDGPQLVDWLEDVMPLRPRADAPAARAISAGSRWR